VSIGLEAKKPKLKETISIPDFRELLFLDNQENIMLLVDNAAMLHIVLPLVVETRSKLL
jgi:hypothetical protein